MHSKSDRLPWFVFAICVAVFTLLVFAIVKSGDSRGDVGSTTVPDERPTTNSENTEHPPEDDVVIGNCGSDPVTGWVEATGTITNNSSKPSSYAGVVKFVAGGVVYGEGMIATNNVAPSQAVEFLAPGVTEARPNTTCLVTRVDRFPSTP